MRCGRSFGFGLTFGFALVFAFTCGCVTCAGTKATVNSEPSADSAAGVAEPAPPPSAIEVVLQLPSAIVPTWPFAVVDEPVNWTVPKFASDSCAQWFVL